MLHAVGFQPDDFRKPQIGIASTWSQVTPCNMHIDELAREAARQANAHEFIEKLPNGYETQVGDRGTQLSGGQQQRAAIARALAPRPRLLLMDEPTSALDPVMTGEVLEVIRELAEQGQQIVLATHEVSFARRVADWVVFLAAGKVVETAAAAAFFEQPQSAEARAYLDSLMRYR
jgi:polar amino acid transport system ATP-binding protein